MTDTEQATGKQPSSKLYWFGLVAAVVAAMASLILVGPKLGLWTTLPGCGPGSGCDAVTNGLYGNIPLGIFLLPVSFVGVAWFGSVANGWRVSRGSSKTLLWIVRLGLLGSAVFVVTMIVGGHFCKWCAAVHLCNLVLWVCAELQYRACGESCREAVFKKFLVCFIALLLVLSVLHVLVLNQKDKSNKRASEANIQRVVEGGADLSTLALLQTDHRFGSSDAPVQIVMFTDYQCPDCKRYETQLARIYGQRNDVSLSIKHFPLNYDCNDEIGTMKMHGNACWAARAAETAFILGGAGGWEKMHTWLFEHGGRFTEPTFSDELHRLGFDPTTFKRIMRGGETLRRVKEDAVDGKALGIWYTPMIFINGVEYLWYYGGQGSLVSVVDKVALAVGTGDTSATAPLSAVDKLIEDWRVMPRKTFPEHEGLSWNGSGAVEIVVWGDYQSEISRVLNNIVIEVLQSEPRAKYAFRHFPIDESCNSGAEKFKNKHPGSCSMAKIVEAVDILSGNNARWKVHDVFMSGQGDLSMGSLAQVAATLCQKDAQTIISVANSQEVIQRVLRDIRAKNAAESLAFSVFRRGVPILVVDGRLVPRWELKGTTGRKTILQLIEESSQ